jgi:hypothetical protein
VDITQNMKTKMHQLTDDGNIECDPRKVWPDTTHASFDRRHVTCKACLAITPYARVWDGRETDSYEGY